MALPIIEQFADALKGQLEAMTLARGYSYEPTVVRRTKRAQAVTASQIRIEQLERQTAATVENYDTWIQPFAVKLMLVGSDADTDALDTLLNNFVGDVTDAVLKTEDWWTSIDGVIDVNIEGPIPFDEDEALDGCTVIVNCQYRHLRGDVYTA